MTSTVTSGAFWLPVIVAYSAGDLGAWPVNSCSALGIKRLPTESIGNFSLTLTNVVIGSRIHVEVASTGVTVTDLVADTTAEVITIPAYSIGSANNDLKVKVRKASASPYYRPYDTQVTAFVGSTSVYISQQPDE